MRLLSWLSDSVREDMAAARRWATRDKITASIAPS
jgi:hypothetical protein